MKYFLEHIARSILREFGGQTREHCIVFPGRRAGLFFLKYLAQDLQKPVWAPAIMTINDLFKTYSDLRPAENEILLFELYRVYRSLRENAESFDDFYYWGDMLLNDFDDVDKHMVEASSLFRNVSDLRQIDQQFGGITEEQARIIRTFWTNFNPAGMTDEKKQFIGMWSLLDKLYSGFRDSLTGKSLAYEGMIFRDVIENGHFRDNQKTNWKMFHFIGFNALNDCEIALMTGLKEEGMARFYWDYDNSYLEPGKINSAGFFIRDNLARFGNDMPAGWNYDTMLSVGLPKVRRVVVETSSDVAQVKLIPELVMKLPGISVSNAHETAVVLADENLLMPVLTSLPPEMLDVNITMGYPLRQTAVYSLIRNLLDLQRNSVISGNRVLFNYIDVLRVIKNSLVCGARETGSRDFIREINDRNLMMVPEDIFEGSSFYEIIFRKIKSADLLSGYLKEILTSIASDKESEIRKSGQEIISANVRNEFIYRVILSINRLDNVTGNTDIKFTIDTWGRILDRLLRTQSVPFSGEPLTGIQVMGILETRALDFKNLVILSVNEGLLPSITASSSFIPFSLRQAFGLPSINHQESIYAYHFFRLLHRAENVTFIYNSNSEGLRSGEMSRFLQQMKYDGGKKPEFSNLSFAISNPSVIGPVVERTEEHNARLISAYSTTEGKKVLSPSAVNTWLNCSMKFYYRYVNGIRESEKISGEIDPAMLGTLLHEVMREIYSGFKGKVVNSNDIKSFSEPGKLTSMTSRAIFDLFRKKDNSVVAVNEQIAANVLQVFVQRIMDIDSKRVPFTILELEKPLVFSLDIKSGDVYISVSAGGYADRIDRKDGVVTIVDYKTGKVVESISAIDDLFKADRSKDPDGWLQTLLYCEGYLTGDPDARVRPSIYIARSVQGEEQGDYLTIKPKGSDSFILNDYNRVRNEYLELFRDTVKIIITGNEPFTMTKDARGKCQWCPYRILCRR